MPLSDADTRTPKSSVQTATLLRGSRLRIASFTGAGALLVLVVGNEVRGWKVGFPGGRVLMDVGLPALFLVLALPCVRAGAAEIDDQAQRRGGRSAGAALKVIVTISGYVLAILCALGLTDYPLGHLLLGGAILGVILGIAAQQSLGNVFAGLVLLFARPFGLGHHIRVRSGALGGEFYGWVVSMGLTYVSISTTEGLLKVPNSSVLAAAVGPFDYPGDVQQASPESD